VTEIIHSMLEDGPTACERCGGTLRRVLYPTGIIFKGSGFYSTDSRPRSDSTAKSDAASQTPATSSDAGGSTDAPKKTDAAPAPPKSAPASEGS
jgi:predicted nucleic acid-binding Zn ribbon protein